MTQTVKLSLLLGFVLASQPLSGCGNPPAPDAAQGKDAVLAKVGDVEITVEDFEETINAYSPYLRQKYSSPEMKKKKLEEMIEFELLALEAKNLGYDADPAVQEALKQQLVRELQEEILSGIKLEDITEEEAKTYYDSNADKYHKPPQVRVAHILMSDKAKAQAMLAELMKTETDAIKWRDAVSEYSEDPENKDHGGDLGYVSKVGEKTEGEPELDAAIVNAAWAITEVGHISPELVEVAGKFHVIKMTSTRPAIDRTFDQVKRQIQSILWKEKREKAQKDFIEELKTKSQVKIDYEALKDVKIPQTVPEVPGLSGMPAEPVEGEAGATPAPGKPAPAATVPVIQAKPE